jgi:hypothetical protein
MCNTCTGADLEPHTVTDAAGRTWSFEAHRIFGPLVLRKDGEPAARQPGSRSSFWPAFMAWNDAQPKRGLKR